MVTLDEARLWLRWSGRDLRARIWTVAAVAAIIALGTGVYAGLTSTTRWRRVSYDQSYAQTHVHDVYIALASKTTLEADRLARAVGDSPGVAGVQTRLVVPVQVDASTASETILVPGRIVGVNLDANPPIDEVIATRGRNLRRADEGRPTVLVDVHFLDRHHLPDRGTIKISGDRTLTYVGAALSPEYFEVLGAEGTLDAQGSFAVLFATQQTAAKLAGERGRANEAIVRLDRVASAEDRRAQAAALDRRLRTVLPDAALTVTALDDQRAYRVMYDDIEGDQRMFAIFAFLVLGGAAFAAFNLVGRIVESQRREIGVAMALGVPRTQIAIRPALVAFEVALIGAVFGVATGLAMSGLVLSLIKTFLPLPVWHAPFDLPSYARGWSIGLALPFLAAMIPVARAVRVDPVNAIRTGPAATRRRGLAPLAARITSGHSIRQMPLRNVLRAPRRTLLTMLAVAAAIATLVGVVGLFDSFLVTVDRGEASILGTKPDRLQVSLPRFAVAGSPELQALITADGVRRAEPALQLPAVLGRGDDAIDAFVQMIPFDSRIWVPRLEAGSLQHREPGIVLSAKAATDLGVEVGDKVPVEHPRRNGTGYRMVTTELPVLGIHEVPYRFVTFMDLRDAGLMNLDGIYNSVTVEPTAGTPVEAVQRTLFEVPEVGSVQPLRAFASSIRDFVQQILSLLRIIEGAVLVLAALIAFNSSAISVDERAREHATMFAFGVTLRTVMRNTVIESLIVGTAGTLVGIGLGRLIVSYITDALLTETLPDVTITPTVSAGTVVTAVVLGIVAVSLAPLFTARRMRHMNIPGTLRVVE